MDANAVLRSLSTLIFTLMNNKKKKKSLIL